MVQVFGILAVLVSLLVPLSVFAQINDALLERAQKGDEQLLFEIAELLVNTPPYDADRALPWYLKAADLGNAEMKTNVANRLSCETCSVNFDESFRLYQQAANQGYARAQNMLGLAYINGEGVPRDASEAIRWWKKAAEQGYGEAMSHLGWQYKTGHGVPQDYVTAHMWYNLHSAISKWGERDREEVASIMTSEQIAEAQKMARECFRRNYKDC